MALLETVFVTTVLGLGTLEWDSGSDQRPSSRSPEDPPECSRDSLFSELCPVGPSQSSRLVREALPNVENVPTFYYEAACNNVLL